MRFLTFLLLAVTLSSPVVGRTVADLNIPERVQIPGHDDSLVLNGAGIRTKMFFKVYVAALYLPAITSDVERIVDGKLPKRVSMHILHSEISKKKMDAAWQEGFEKNTPADHMAALQQSLDQFKDLFGDLREGDVVALDYLPGVGTRITINGKEQGLIEGEDFSAALLRVWLGQEPVTKSLKQDMLGI